MPNQPFTPDREKEVARAAALLTGESLNTMDLDDLVHREVSSMASGINNGGTWNQLDFLLSRGWNPDNILQEALANSEEHDQ